MKAKKLPFFNVCVHCFLSINKQISITIYNKSRSIIIKSGILLIFFVSSLINYIINRQTKATKYGGTNMRHFCFDADVKITCNNPPFYRHRERMTTNERAYY